MAAPCELRIVKVPEFVSTKVESRNGLNGLGADIVSQEWQINFHLQPTGRLSADAVPQSIKMLFGQGDATPAFPAQLLVLLSRPVGIRAPSEIHFGFIGRGELKTKRFLISSNDGRAFRLTGASAKRNLLKLSAKLRNAAKVHIVDAGYECKEPGHLDEQIIIATDHPDSPEIVIQAKGIGIVSTN